VLRKETRCVVGSSRRPKVITTIQLWGCMALDLAFQRFVTSGEPWRSVLKSFEARSAERIKAVDFSGHVDEGSAPSLV
jgi:hypothetical protein